MNQFDELKVEAFVRSNNLLIDSAVCYETNVTTKGQVQALSGLVASLLGYAEIMDQPIAGLVEEKNQTKRELVFQLYPFTNGLVCYANSLPDATLLAKVNISNSALMRLNEVKLVAFANQTLGISKANLPGLALYSITEEMCTNLERLLGIFNLKRTERKLLMDKKKAAGKEFNRLKKEINHLLNKKLDPSIENLRSAHPEFVSKYFSVRQTGRSVHHAYDLLGYITDATTGQPVAYGTVWVEELDMRTDITPKGTFRFKSLPEGKYRLKIENMDYKTRYVSISRYAPEHCKLNLTLEPLAVEETQPV